MAKNHFPSGGHSRQKAWKSLAAGAELFHLRSFRHFSLSRWVNALSASLFVSITLSASLPLLPLTPSASFPLYCHSGIFCSFPSHLSLLSLSLSLSQYIGLYFPPLPRLLLCFFPVFFFPLIWFHSSFYSSPWQDICLPSPPSLARAHTHAPMHTSSSLFLSVLSGSLPAQQFWPVACSPPGNTAERGGKKKGCLMLIYSQTHTPAHTVI